MYIVHVHVAQNLPQPLLTISSFLKLAQLPGEYMYT